MPPTSIAPDEKQRRKRRAFAFAAATLITLVTCLAYANSFRAPFLLDDASAIVENPSIRSLASVGNVLSPPATATTGGRPLLNLSFAANWALAGGEVAGYHVVNLAIHVLSALFLFGTLRRVLASERLGRWIGTAAAPLALFAALIWALHPLHTESVTYISQRAESLMGCCYLATLYCFARGLTSPLQTGWFALSVAICALGMTVKEVMVTAPVMVALLDRSFYSASFGDLLRRRWRLYAGFAATWALLVALMLSARVDTWSEGAALGIRPWTYALNEAVVVLRYLKLSGWPHPLVFDYGTGVYAASVFHTLPAFVAIAAIIALAVSVWRKMPVIGFGAVAFFLLLAPTSSVVPIVVQPMAESRLYLPVAALSAMMVMSGFALAGKRVLPAFGFVAMAFAALTFARNADYSTGVRIWSDSVAKFPSNDRARNNLGLVLLEVPDRERDAQAEFEAAIRLNRANSEAHYNLANLLAKADGELERALREYAVALEARPDYKRAHNNLGLLLQKLPGRLPEAIDHFEAAARLPPDTAEEHSNLAGALLAAGHLPEAVQRYEKAVALARDNSILRFNLANALLASRRDAEAVLEYRRALALRPNHVEAHNNLAAALLRTGRPSEAVEELQAAVRLRPQDTALQETLRRVQAATRTRDPNP